MRGAHRAQPQVGGDDVGHRGGRGSGPARERGLGGGEHDLGVDEPRVLGGPQELVVALAVHLLAQVDGQPGRGRLRQPRRHLRQQAALNAQAGGDPRALRDGARHGRLELDGVAGPVRRPGELGDRGARHRLQPDALPDAGRTRVPDVVGLGLPILLAAGLPDVQGPVLGPHDEHGVGIAGGQSARDVEREGGVPALVLAHELAVDPDARPVVDRAEMQQYPVALSRQAGAGQIIGGEHARVPHDGVVAGVPDAGELALGREGHGDGPLIDAAVGPVLVRARLGVVVGEVPLTVQTAPAGAAQLRRGVSP